MDKEYRREMRKALSCALGIFLVSVVLWAVISAAVSPAGIPGDADKNNELTRSELASAIISYMLGEGGALKIEDLRDAAYVYVYWHGEPRTILDYLNRTVTIYKPPKRIVSLTPSNTEILFELGLGDKIAGVTTYCNYPPEAEEKPKIGGYTNPDSEKVLAMNPDLVVAAHGTPIDTVNFLVEYVPVVALHARNLSGVMENIKLLGKATGEDENASKLVDWMGSEIEKIREEAENWKGKNITVAHIVWYEPIWVSGKDTFINDLIETAGGKNAFTVTGWAMIGKGELIKIDPDVIITEDEFKKEIMEDEDFKGIKAVKNGRVYTMNSDIISRPSYRLIYALQEIAGYLRVFG